MFQINGPGKTTINDYNHSYGAICKVRCNKADRVDIE